MAKKTGLGRGLGSLISGGVNSANRAPSKKAATKPAKKSSGKKAGKASGAKEKPKESVLEGTRPFPNRADGDGARETATGLYEVPVSRIQPNPRQPRKSFSEEHLKELAESIRSEGLLQPVVVRHQDSHYELIAGERRWRACQLLKLRYIPARIMQASESSSAVLSLIENLQREDLNPIEEAMGLASLLKDFDLTQEQVAERVGRSRAAVANALRLLQLPREIQGYLIKGHLSVGHAKVLLGVEDAETRLALARQAIEREWSVRETERRVEQSGSSPSRKSTARKQSGDEQAALRSLENQLSTGLSTRVFLKHSPRKGRIIIEYYGNDDLQRIMEKMGMP
ncbi:MAG: ParB/RepB/Spo0J family partition protein [Verrucomicrobia bacterium]|jgi:ParB family chromosome partitioning protein|nr:ParB/RepB/Spo0J family partition protein [Verrucomicrobiota bacterium]